ncbi:hypothetical protein HDC93_006464 [Streptomyces sp. AK010]|nr:hypothetical protein [Streptomyces sp. AK010]
MQSNEVDTTVGDFRAPSVSRLTSPRRPGTVIAATGYQPNLHDLVEPLGVINEDGHPLAPTPETTSRNSAPALHRAHQSPHGCPSPGGHRSARHHAGVTAQDGAGPPSLPPRLRPHGRHSTEGTLRVDRASKARSCSGVPGIVLISFEASTLRRSAGGRSPMRASARCRSKPRDQVQPVQHFPGRNPPRSPGDQGHRTPSACIAYGAATGSRRRPSASKGYLAAARTRVSRAGVQGARPPAHRPEVVGYLLHSSASPATSVIPAT